MNRIDRVCRFLEKKKKKRWLERKYSNFFLDLFLLQKLIAFQVRILFLLRVGEHIIVQVGLGFISLLYIYILREAKP